MRVRTGKQTPLPCKLCGALPELRSVDVHFVKDDTLMTTRIELRCSNLNCDHEHRHFGPKATRREAIIAWNKSNKPKE